MKNLVNQKFLHSQKKPENKTLIAPRMALEVSSASNNISSEAQTAEKFQVCQAVSTYLLQTENWIFNQIRFLKDFRSIVYCLNEKKPNKFDGPLIHSLNRDLSSWRKYYERGVRKFVTGYYPYFYRKLKIEKPQLIHAHFGWTGLNFLPLAKAFNLPLITSFYGADLSLQKKTTVKLQDFYKPLFADGELFLVEGPAAFRQLTTLGCPPDKIQIQRLGVDLEALPFHTRQAAPEKPIKILIASTFTEKKGIPYAIEAFCKAARVNSRLMLTVIGDARPEKPQEHILKRELQEIVNRNEMNNRVDFLGYVDIEQLYALAYDHHLLIQSSITAASGDTEGGSPVIITEMCASGMPVIASDHCDIPEVVQHEHNGIIVQEKDITGLYKAILRLAGDDDLRERMAIFGRAHIEKKYNAREQGMLLNSIYRSVINQRHLDY